MQCNDGCNGDSTNKHAGMGVFYGIFGGGIQFHDFCTNEDRINDKIPVEVQSILELTVYPKN